VGLISTLHGLVAWGLVVKCQC